MGNFYVELCVMNSSPDQLTNWLRLDRQIGFVGPTVNGWTCVVTKSLEMQNPIEIARLGAALSQSNDVLVLSVLNHDDDVLAIDLYAAGNRVAGFNSCPGYFTEDPAPEQLVPRLDNPELLASLMPGLAPYALV